MNPVVFFIQYFGWHYSSAIRDLLYVWKNFFWFLARFFSVRLLFGSLFSPYKRITEEFTKSGAEAFFESLAVNIMSRVVGVLIRSCILIFAILVLGCWFILLFAAMLFWFTAPVVIAGMFVYGFTLLFV